MACNKCETHVCVCACPTRCFSVPVCGARCLHFNPDDKVETAQHRHKNDRRSASVCIQGVCVGHSRNYVPVLLDEIDWPRLYLEHSVDHNTWRHYDGGARYGDDIFRGRTETPGRQSNVVFTFFSRSKSYSDKQWEPWTRDDYRIICISGGEQGV